MRMLLKNFLIFAAAGTLVMGWVGEDEYSITSIAADEGGDAWDKAILVRTRHFSLRTDAPNDEAKKLAADLERFRKAFFDFFSGSIDPGKVSKSLEVHFYNDYKRYQQAMRKAHPEREQSDGFFNSKDGVAHFFRIRTKSPNAVVTDRETVFHECTHQIMHHAVGSIAAATKKPHFWAVEGLAGYFEGLGADEGRPNRFKILVKYRDEAKKIKLASFVLHTQQSLISTGVPDVNYAAATGFAHLLATHDGGKHKDAFRRYALAVHEGKAAADTFKNIFGQDPASFQSDWEKFLDGLKD